MQSYNSSCSVDIMISKLHQQELKEENVSCFYLIHPLGAGQI